MKLEKNIVIKEKIRILEDFLVDFFNGVLKLNHSYNLILSPIP